MEMMNTWRGRPIEDLSREELIQALKELGSLYMRHIEDSIKSMQTMRELAAVRR